MEFIVKAVTGEDAIVSLVVDAVDEQAARRYAKAQGYSVIGIVRRGKIWAPHSGSRAFSALLFSRQLLGLLSAGLSLIEALEVLQKGKRGNEAEGVVEGVIASLSEGLAFSAAISRYPQHFSALYVASVQASERTGNLREALRRYVEYQEQADRVRKRLISASMYPGLLAGVGVLVILFLLLYVVPRFSKVYEGFAGDLPFFSKMLVAIGSIISDYGWMMALAIIALAAILAFLAATPSAQIRMSRWIRSVPRIADTLRQYEITRLYRTLGMLLRSGIPISRAVRMAGPQLGTVARANLEKAGALISEGKEISAAMDAADLTTPIATRMLLVGERTGDMGVMMEHIAEFHEEELSRWIEDFSKLFEPLLMLALGLIVGTVVVLMYMPVFELATIVQ